MVKNSYLEYETCDAEHGTFQLRRQADELLQRLIVGREQSEQRLMECGRRDAIKCVTGRSAIDEAIETTRSMIREMDAMLEEMNTQLQESSPAAVPTSHMASLVADCNR